MKKFTLGELEEIFKRLKKVYDGYLKIPKEKLYKTISSADGKKMYISLPISSVPHLLGIDTNCYSAIFSSKQKSSNKIFEEMLDKGAYNLYNNANKLGFDISLIISPYVFEKLDNFFNILWLDIEKIEFICHYDKEKSYSYKDESYDFDHLILTKLDDSKYSLVTLSDNETENGIITVPRSNQLINDAKDIEQKLFNILENQAITIATLFTYNFYGEPKQFFLRDEFKKIKIEEARLYCKKYKSNLDISYDYLNVLRFSERKTDLSKSKRTYLELIADAIKTGDRITEEYLNVESFSELPKEVILIVYEYNNSLLRKGTNKEIEINYSDMNEANKKLRSENSDLRARLEELNSKLKEKDKKLKGIIEDNEELNKKIEQARKALG